ncbi:hypothetical protein B0T17DRAFT_340918 [Bombardia bombarda]|uniref:Uncharacterized protein n=1 Tax=Bombardia bombarda TaxID=252184 RepID=A0AA40BYF4_9PEZI|nr:hypothetical protein B0T17DRAFT_340918 [Bombardia bombarda]
MSALTTENDFCLDEPAIHLHHHTSLLESVSGTGSGSGSGSGPSKTSPDSTATHFQLNNHSNTTRGHYPADGECNCLKQLTSSLFNLNNWSQSGGGGGGVSAPSSTAAAAAQGLSFMSWMDFDTFLVLHKDSMEKWDGVKDCRSACFLRREYAVLLIMNVEQLATLQLDLVAVITSANADNGENDGAGGDDSLRAAAASRRGSKTGSGGSGGSGGSSSRRSRKSSPLPSSVAPSPFSSSASSKRPMSIGKFVIDDASDEAMIVMQLLGARISHLTSFVKSLRPRLVQAGLDECCTKLDAAMVALGKASRHIKSR